MGMTVPLAYQNHIIAFFDFEIATILSLPQYH